MCSATQPCTDNTFSCKQSSFNPSVSQCCKVAAPVQPLQCPAGQSAPVANQPPPTCATIGSPNQCQAANAQCVAAQQPSQNQGVCCLPAPPPNGAPACPPNKGTVVQENGGPKFCSTVVQGSCTQGTCETDVNNPQQAICCSGGTVLNNANNRYN